MHPISSLSCANIEAPIPPAISPRAKELPQTARVTVTNPAENTPSSIRSRKEFLPSFTASNPKNKTSLASMQEKEALFAALKPVSNNADLAPTEASLHAILDRLTLDASSIENQRLAKIQAAENTANASQAHGMRRGMGMAVSYGVEEAKQRTFEAIEKTATHQRIVLFLEAKQALLNHQEAYFSSLLETYSTQLSSSPEAAAMREDVATCKELIHQSFVNEQKVFSLLGDLEQASESALAATIKAIGLASTIRMRALHPFVEHSINAALDQIKETNILLHTLSLSKNRFLNTNALASFDEDFAQRYDHYLLAEALFDGTATTVAQHNASYLQTKIEELHSELSRSSLEQSKAAPGDSVLFDQKTTLLRNLSIALETAQKAYERIAGDTTVKTRIPLSLPSAALEIPVTADQDNAFLKEAFDALSELTTQTTVTSRTEDLNILSRLDLFSEEAKSLTFSGRRGEIELVDSHSPLFTPNAMLAQEGINLVRLAIFRDYGAKGLQHFDGHFHDKRVALESPEAHNFLTIGELKNFILTEANLAPRAFYLSPAHSIAELIFEEHDLTQDSMPLKADGVSFNPFSSITPSIPSLTADQEIKAAHIATRAALKEFFKDIPGDLRQLILNRFDDKFKSTKTLVTVGEFRSFLQQEMDNLTTFNWDVTGPFLYSLTWHLATASLWTVMMSVHPPAWVIMGISLGMGVGHDLTSYWRQLRPEEER